MTSPVQKTTLPNGIRILSKRMPFFRSVSMGIWVNVGTRDEIPEENGLTHFIEHMIFKGTPKRTAHQIAVEFDAVGGQTNAFTTMENTCYYARVLDIHLEKMVDILADIFLNSSFDPEEVERERQIIIQEISMIEDSPEDLVHHLAGCAFWGDNPLGQSILGSVENISDFKAPQLLNYFKKCYQPDRIVVSAAGNVDHNALVDMISPHFEKIQTSHPFSTRAKPSGRSALTVYPKQLEQTHICIGTDGISTLAPQRYDFAVLHTILGGNMSSRLIQEIREKKGLAYSVYSFLTSYLDAGMFGVYLAVSPDKAEKAMELVFDQLSRIKTDGISFQELNGAKEFTKGNLLIADESIDNQMVRLAQNEINFQRYIPIDEVIENVDQVTVDSVTELADNTIKDNPTAITILGPDLNPADFEKFMPSNPS